MLLYVITESEYVVDQFTGMEAEMLRVIDIRDESGTDYSFLVSPEQLFQSLLGARHEIAAALNVAPEEVELEVV